MPDPTKTPSTPSCIISAASAGGEAAGREVHDRQLPLLRDHAHEVHGRAELLRLRTYCSGRSWVTSAICRSIARW